MKYLRHLIFFLSIIVASGCYASIKLIENKGQWQQNIRYRAELTNGYFYVEKNTLTYSFYDTKALDSAIHFRHAGTRIKRHVTKVKLLGANENINASAQNASEEYYNYFYGKNPEHWVSHAYAYSKVLLANVWNKIDMEIITDDDALKYNFIVHPGGKVSDIRMQYDGADAIGINEDGNLRINTSLCNIIEEKPYAYSVKKEEHKSVKCSYLAQGNQVHFSVGSYNHFRDLVIDPRVIFATYSGSVAHNYGFTATYDLNGYTYSGGIAFSDKFPVNTGAFQEKYAGGVTDISRGVHAHDCAILKYNVKGTGLQWATYFGGSNNEQPHSMVADKGGNLYIMGSTQSADMPVWASGFDTSYNGNGDIFIAEISADGTKLLGGTYLGGSDMDGFNGTADTIPHGKMFYNYGDRYRGEVILDSGGNVLVVSCTRSNDLITKKPFQTTFGGMQDGCVFKLGAGLNNLLFGSYIGGSDEDAAYGINPDKNGNYFICGGTFSNDLKVGSTYQNSYGGKCDGFIYKLDKDGSYINSTYYGTPKYDQCFLIQTNDVGEVYVYGQTEGDMPVVGKVYSNKNGRQFITAFDNDLINITVSTVIGAGRRIPELSPSAFLFDLCGRVCLSGWGGPYVHYGLSDTSDVFGFPITNDAWQTSTDGADFYLMILSRGMKDLIYGTYLGGKQSREHVDGGTSRFNRDGIIYQSVCAGCGGFSDFPTTADAWSRVNKGIRWDNKGGCNNAVFKMDMNSSNYFPYVSDTTLVLTAGDDLNYLFSVNDSDKSDSIFIAAQSDIFDASKTGNNAATFSPNKGNSFTRYSLRWKTNCSHISSDTYYVYLSYTDNGCPTPKSGKSIIKLVVKYPPPPIAPRLFCLRNIDANTLKVEWGSANKDVHGGYCKLVRSATAGNPTVLTVFNGNLGAGNFFIDKLAVNHATTEYFYTIYAVDGCGKTTDSSLSVSTIAKDDSIPTPLYMFTVSVEENKYLRIIWNKQSRQDFRNYILYKKINDSSSAYIRYKVFNSADDTSFRDSAVKVNEYSYCYRLASSTLCGNVSPPGNEGCSILLKGDSYPFKHDLSWNIYRQWQGGVEVNNLYRKEEADFFIREKLSSFQTDFTDSALNLDWGLYHYKIIAKEGKGGKGAVSVSNEVKLLQLPIVYMPNAFTPNGDMINDSLTAKTAFVRDWHMRVYSRWGERLWDTQNKHTGWNGRYLDNSSLLNVIIWQVEYSGWDDVPHFKHGNATVVR